MERSRRGKWRSFILLFMIVWSIARVADAALTWYIISNGYGYERNPLAVLFIREYGLGIGLALFTVLGILAGAALALGVPRLLRCVWCRTRFDRVLLDALGVEGVARVIMATALGLGLAPILINLLCLGMVKGWMFD